MKKVIDYIRNELHCRVKPSSIEGVGLFAIKDIPKDTNLSKDFPIDIDVQIHMSDLVNIHPNVLKLLKDYWEWQGEVQWIQFKNNMKHHLVNYVNHSDEPNIVLVSEPDNKILPVKL